jgi:hypothetical protein
VMRARTGTVRWVTAQHRLSRKAEVLGPDEWRVAPD